MLFVVEPMRGMIVMVWFMSLWLVLPKERCYGDWIVTHFISYYHQR